MGTHAPAGWASGHASLDAELPGGGWPLQTLTEILQPPQSCAIWRLLSPALSCFTDRGGVVFLIGPPYQPHLPGLVQRGLAAHQVFWVRCASQAERLWAAEQALKAQAVSAVLCWLPQARPEHMRRLQACATRHPGLLFAMRPAAAAREASAAPLRLLARLSAHQARLEVDILKRRGPLLTQTLDLSLPDLPGLRDRSDPSVPRHPAPAMSWARGHVSSIDHVPALDRLVIG